MIRDRTMKIHTAGPLACQIINLEYRRRPIMKHYADIPSVYTLIYHRDTSQGQARGNIVLKRLRKKRPGRHLLWSDAVHPGYTHSFTTQSKSHASPFKHTWLCQLVIISTWTLGCQAQSWNDRRVNTFLCMFKNDSGIRSDDLGQETY